MLYTGYYIAFISAFLTYLSSCASYDYNLIKGYLSTQFFIDNNQIWYSNMFPPLLVIDREVMLR